MPVGVLRHRNAAGGVWLSAGFARFRDSIRREGVNLSCRTEELPLTQGGGNSDGRQERRKGLVLGCTAILQFLQSHGTKTGNGVSGTGQAVVGEKGNALVSAPTRQGIIVWGSTLVSAAVRAWLVRERTRCRRWRRREEGEVRACSGFRGGPSLLLRQNDQQHVLQGFR